MAKRNHSDLSHGLGVDNHDERLLKKTRPSTPSLSEIAHDADNLIKSLESFKRSRQTASNNDEKASLFPQVDQLAELSQELLPLLESLATINEEPSDGIEKTPGGSGSQLLPIPSSVAAAPWKAADIPQELPPLPMVDDSEIESQAFRHPGLSGAPSYERLEWLGDAYLELIATTIISRTFTTMPPGRCSQMREQLIRNTTLADYFRKYGMDKKARLPPEITKASVPGRGRSADKDLIKTQGDMFEAYVAAIIVSDPQHGLTKCINWLRDLWSMTLKDQIIKAEKDHQTDAAARTATTATGATKRLLPKDELSKAIVVKGIKVEYKDKPGKAKKCRDTNMPLFTVGVYLTGWGEQDKLLGWGTAINKREAGQKAAAMALENKKQLKVYEQQKAAYLAAEGARAAPAGEAGHPKQA